jgi:hypothetical protein
MAAHEFRMPSQARRREYLWAALAFLVGGPAVAVASGTKLQLELLVFVVGVILGALLLTYLLQARAVWVVVSPEGIRGRSVIGRAPLLLWSEAVLVLPVSPASARGLPGVTMARIAAGGKPSLSGSVFIPRAILESAQFQAAIAALAPGDHALRRASSAT